MKQAKMLKTASRIFRENRPSECPFQPPLALLSCAQTCPTNNFQQSVSLPSTTVHPSNHNLYLSWNPSQPSSGLSWSPWPALNNHWRLPLPRAFSVTIVLDFSHVFTCLCTYFNQSRKVLPSDRGATVHKPSASHTWPVFVGPSPWNAAKGTTFTRQWYRQPSNVPYLETPSPLNFCICNTEAYFKTNAVLICCRHWRPTCIQWRKLCVLIGLRRQSICHDTVKWLTDSFECLWHRISIHSLAGTIHLLDKTKISYTAGLLFMINKW